MWKELSREDIDLNAAVAAGFAPADFVPADLSEKQSFLKIRPSRSYWQDALGRLAQNYVAMGALAVLVLLVLFAFVGPYFVPYAYDQQLRGAENLFPMTYSSAETAFLAQGQDVFPHVFGTDKFGRDIMVRVMYGTRVSMIIGVAASAIVLVIGSAYGSIAGYFGGRVDFVMMRLVELIYSIPDILVVLLLSAVIKEPLKNLVNNTSSTFIRTLGGLGAGLLSIFIVFGLLYWVGMSRIIRGQILSLKQQEYVTAARALGASSGRIIKRHLLPNCIGQIIVTTMLQIPSAIFTESFLSFLGLGVAAPMASLGSMCSDALGGIYTYAYRLVIPAVTLSLLILCFNLFGDGLRDALDPKMKR